MLLVCIDLQDAELGDTELGNTALRAICQSVIYQGDVVRSNVSHPPTVPGSFASSSSLSSREKSRSFCFPRRASSLSRAALGADVSSQAAGIGLVLLLLKAGQLPSGRSCGCNPSLRLRKECWSSSSSRRASFTPVAALQVTSSP